MNRRSFLQSAALSSGAVVASSAVSPVEASAIQEDAKPSQEFCAFIKFVQSLSYDELAQRLSQMGFNGIEATIRNNGYISPEKAEEELPKLVEALAKHNMHISIMTSDINRVTPENEKLMTLAARLGIPRFRMKYYRYDLAKPIKKQIELYNPIAKELAEACREIGIVGCYQNHSGARNLGATIWDLAMLLEGVSPEHLEVSFDLRHAKAEAGLSWQVYWDIIRPHVGSLYVKDFEWSDGKPKNVALGNGVIDPKFFSRMVPKDFTGPISLHVEYLGKEDAETNMKALEVDLKKLRSWMD